MVKGWCNGSLEEGWKSHVNTSVVSGTRVTSLQSFVDLSPSEGEVPQLVRKALRRLASEAASQELCLRPLDQ